MQHKYKKLSQFRLKGKCGSDAFRVLENVYFSLKTSVIHRRSRSLAARHSGYVALHRVTNVGSFISVKLVESRLFLPIELNA